MGVEKAVAQADMEMDRNQRTGRNRVGKLTCGKPG